MAVTLLTSALKRILSCSLDWFDAKVHSLDRLSLLFSTSTSR